VGVVVHQEPQSLNQQKHQKNVAYQVPQFLYEAGYGCREFPERAGMIGVTQPRRVAAISTAQRVAHELGARVGAAVGYQVRGQRPLAVLVQVASSTQERLNSHPGRPAMGRAVAPAAGRPWRGAACGQAGADRQTTVSETPRPSSARRRALQRWLDARRLTGLQALPLTSCAGAVQVRYDRRVGAGTAVKFMTDGILMRELQDDFLLRKYSAIVVDEAHERSLNTDILLGGGGCPVLQGARSSSRQQRDHVSRALRIICGPVRPCIRLFCEAHSC
jgi:hypothetical protein